MSYYSNNYYTNPSNPIFSSQIPNSINTDTNTVNKYSGSINANILTVFNLAQDLLDVSNMIKIKTLSNIQLERLDGTLRNVIGALNDIRALLG